VGVDDIVEVSAVVTNTGERHGDEVVQLYASDPVASITRPVRELVAFERVSLQAGASARVTFEVPVAALGFSGPTYDYVVEPGDVEFFVGASATDVVPAGTVTISGDALVTTVRRTATRTTVSPIG
jgi:hypothetical protein